MTAQTTSRAGRPIAAPSPPSGLSEESIVAAAKAALASVGVADFTMRRLSDDLGVTLGATYHYLPSRHAVLVRTALSIQDELDLPDTSTGTWVEWVRTLLVNLVNAVGPYAGLASFMLTNSEANSQAIPRAMSGYLERAGFSAEGAEPVLSALFFYVAGMMASGLASGTRGLSRRAMTVRFNAGLDVLLKGAEAELVEDRKRRRPD